MSVAPLGVGHPQTLSRSSSVKIQDIYEEKEEIDFDVPQRGVEIKVESTEDLTSKLLYI